MYKTKNEKQQKLRNNKSYMSPQMQFCSADLLDSQLSRETSLYVSSCLFMSLYVSLLLRLKAML